MPTPPTTLRRASLLFAILNLLAAALFLILLFVEPFFSDLDARIRFRQLDDAGVINAPALAAFNPSYRFGDGTDLIYRSTIPAFLTQPAAAQSQLNALLALLLTGANAALWSAAWWSLRKKNPTPRPPA